MQRLRTLFYHPLTLSFCHLSFTLAVFLSLLSLFITLVQKRFLLLTRHCRCAGEKHRHEISLDTHTHTHTHTHTQKHSNPPRQWVESRQNQTTERKEASGEKSETKSRRLRFHYASLSARISNSLCCLSSLVSDPPRRIAAVKLLTSPSTSVMTLHSAATLRVGVCVRVCGCQSEFLTSSSGSVMTSVLTRGLEKRGSSLSLVFLYSSPLLPVTDPQRGEGQLCIDAFCCQWPSFNPPLGPFNI